MRKEGSWRVRDCVAEPLFNARDAVGKDVTIEISAHNAPVEDQVIIEVADHGSGITRENIEPVFEPFLIDALLRGARRQ